jgi:hypothetical protein
VTAVQPLPVQAGHMTDRDYTLALGEARREVEGLYGQAETIRSRSLQLVAYGAISLSVAGGLAAYKGQLVGLVATVLGLAAFVALVWMVASIVVPTGLARRLDPKLLVGPADGGMPRYEQERNFALHLGAYYLELRPKVNSLYGRLRWAIIALGVELTALVLGLVLG